jgi:DNA replication initiation complex subunit (GINS family)
MVEISYEALRKIQMQERNFGALSTLDEDFYERYNLWVMEQKRLLQSQFSIETLKAYENAKKILEEVSAKREQKIVLKALKDLKGNSVDTAGLSKEEKEFYLNIITSAKDFEASAVKFSEKRQEFKKEAEKASERLLTLKIITALGKFVASDGNTYGPFSADEVVNIEKSIGELLVKKGIGELIEDGRKDKPEAPKMEENKGLPDTVFMN